MKYLVVGSGIGGVTFAEELRKLDSACEIIILTRDRDYYYFRPNLTHGFCSNNQDSLVAKTFAQLRASGIQVFEGVDVTHIAHREKKLLFRAGESEVTLDYDVLVMATGSVAFIPPEYQAFQKLFLTLHSRQDLELIKAKSRAQIEEHGKCHFGIIGGGAIGCELASELAHCGQQVDIIHLNARLLDRLLSEDESKRLQTLFLEKQIAIHLNQQVQAIEATANGTALINQSGDIIGQYDLIILAIGFSGNTQLALQSEIPCHRGIVVNEYLQTEVPHVYAIGDVAEVQGKSYLFTLPIWDQASYLAKSLVSGFQRPWQVPEFSVNLKIHDF